MPNVRVRELVSVRTAAPQPSEDDLALINGSGLSRQPVTAEDVHIRQARVAHNQYDRTLERFQKAHLERFAETLPGKSVLPGHDTSQLPLGRWFRADTRTRSEDFPVLQRQRKAAEIVPGMESQRQRVTWLEAGFYFANDPSTDGMRKNIDTGVYQDVSIGFAYDDVDCDVCKKSYLRSNCPHYRGQELEGGELVTLTYSGEPKVYEARETSIVYLGAQQQAELVKQIREGRLDPKALAQTSLGEDLIALKEFEALARIHGHRQKAWAFPALKQISPPVDGDEPRSVGRESDDDDPAALAANGKEAEMAFLERIRKALGLPDTASEDEAVTAAEKAKAELSGAEAGKAALAEAQQKAAQAAAHAKIGETALTDLKAAILDDDRKLTKADPSAELVDIVNLHVEKGNYVRLREMAAEKHAAVLVKWPAGKSGDAGATGADADADTTRFSAAEIRQMALSN